jgi:pyruvate/2-oxoglutarate dehydrogenase complex dihydrolipoamide dehydrogenase (E3) component
MEQFDLLVVGGGSAGLKAARTAARMGRRVALAEERELGGECFWAGCVPTKAMVRAAEVWHLVRRAHEFGIDAEVRRADFRDAMAYKERAVRAVGGGGEPDAGLGRLGVRYFHARATFCDPNVLQIGREVVRADKVLLATGTVPFVPHIEGLEETGYITNREAVALESLPRSLLILGGGPIGLEFGQVFRRFGADVTVIELGSQILPHEDTQIAELVAGYLRDEGIRVMTSTRALEVRSLSGRKRVEVEVGRNREMIEVEEILVATGRAAAVGDLDLESAGVEYTQRAITTDEFLRTNQSHIWTAGDCAGGYLFTHVASYEGTLAAENMFAELPRPYNPRVVPRATFVDPEVASIGYTESAAIQAGLDVATQSFSFSDLDRALLYADARGMVKLVLEAPTGQIVGAHIVGPHASSVIQEIVLAMQHRLPVSAIAETMHAYPSFPEAVEAAALSTPSYVGKVEGDAK